ncbi:hypothetical protein GN244_ATG02103 [Phytophthora infestans]|uniref:Uncharacterized protein n=1 Tax=Phytophthora infestans TaxID=4787 RepID=A0A833WPN9_PHYIN|nr:hypothetical protein GN244_ATG02103 [Phytophthora infestans]
MKDEEKNPDKFAIISDLAKRFDDDLDLARALNAAKINFDLSGNTDETIVNLQKLQFEQWIWKKHWNPKELSYALAFHMSDPKYLGVYLSFDTFFKASRAS